MLCQAKGDTAGLALKNCVPTWDTEFDEELYKDTLGAGLLTRLGCVQGLRWSVFLLILRSFSGPFNLASDGFLAAPSLISNCSNPPVGTQGRSWRLESCLVSGLNEAQVLDVSSQKESSERQSDRHEADLFRGKHTLQDRVWPISEGEKGLCGGFNKAIVTVKLVTNRLQYLGSE